MTKQRGAFPPEPGGNQAGAPPRVLVTGAGGLLGQALVPAFAEAGYAVIGLSRAELDVSDAQAVAAAFADWRPQLVLHAAAYTKVDQAEAEPEAALRVNRDGSALVAAAAARHEAAIVYFSTDYVFDGRTTRPIPTEAPAAPLSVYGRSKWLGEEAVRAATPRHWIIRTSWLYGSGGPNFVETMRRFAATKPEVRVVDDQIGAPTWAVELARMTAQLVGKGAYGPYHAACQGHCSWYEFAKAIWQELELATPLAPTTTAALARPAPRPAFSVFDLSKLKALGIEPLHWQDALRHYLHGRIPAQGSVSLSG